MLDGNRRGIDNVIPIYYGLTNVLYAFSSRPSVRTRRRAAVRRCLSRLSLFIDSQADNLFFLDPRHARATTPLRPQDLDQASHARDGFCFTSRPSSVSGVACVQPHGLISATSSYSTTSRLYQHNCQQAALPPEAHTFVGTQRAPIVDTVGLSQRRRLGRCTGTIRDV